MTLYLRNIAGETIVDIDIYVKSENGRKFIELNSSVIVDTYSELLLKYRDSLKVNIKEDTDVFIASFYSISELRGWMWETYFVGGDNDPEKLKDVISHVTNFLKDIAKKYNLYFVTD